MNEEDDDDGGAMGATRYPCMPSLVSLQQMRNRLHLAYLGKKLMKWTALATGRELRRITEDLNLAYQNFGEDIREYYILLARSRYFYPNLNKMVIENVPCQTSLRVFPFTKTVAGVKVIHYDIIEVRLNFHCGGTEWNRFESRTCHNELYVNCTGCERYPHLAIEQGGQVVKTAKDAWMELLKRMVMIVQLRQSFKLVDEANRSATKRQNVLSKTVIPRIQSSIRYIILELEELAREELYRIKKVVEFKKRKKDKLKALELGAAKLAKVEFIETETVQSDNVPEPVELVDTQPEICSYPCQSTADYLKDQLASVISLSKGLMTSKISTIDFGSFLKHCEKVKQGMSEAFQSEKSKEYSEKQSLKDDDLNKRLELLKSHLGAVIDITKEFRAKVNISPSVEGFNNLCQTVNDKLDLYFQDNRSPKVSIPCKDRLECLKEHIKDTEELTEDYKSKGIITSGSEKFLDACAHIKSKIDSYNKNVDKLQHLKDHVTDLEQLTTGIKEDGMTSDSIEEFLLACKEFKARIAQYKSEDETPPSDGKITKLIEQINTAIELSNAAKKNGLVTDSVQNFIRSCEDVKKRLEQKSQHQETPTVLRELQDNLQDVVNLISELQATGTITTSVENFLKCCQDTKAKICNYGKRQTYDGDSDPEFMYPTYNPTFSECETNLSCEKCEMWIEESSATSSGIIPIEPKNTPPPKKTKKTSDKKKQNSNDLHSLTCVLSGNHSKNIDKKKTGSDDRKVKIKVDTDSENLSEIDENDINDKNPTDTCCSETVEAPKGDDNLVFEKKVKKIVKVTRTLNKDGTVKEEKEETITMTVTGDQDETDFDDVIDQASKTGSEKR